MATTVATEATQNSCKISQKLLLLAYSTSKSKGSLRMIFFSKIRSEIERNDQYLDFGRRDYQNNDYLQN